MGRESDRCAWTTVRRGAVLTGAVCLVDVEFIASVTRTDEAADRVTTTTVRTERREQRALVQV